VGTLPKFFFGFAFGAGLIGPSSNSHCSKFITPSFAIVEENQELLFKGLQCKKGLLLRVCLFAIFEQSLYILY
jgi:hypothetical protein